MTRSVEPFVPAGDEVKIYVCGLTPSAEAHLGHARSFMFFDVLRRHLKRRGYAVTYVQNVTDVDDRSIARAKETGEDWRVLVERNYAGFKAAMRKLGVLEPDREPRATEYIGDILTMIVALVERGFAYQSDDGVYYSVKKFPRYGELSHKNVDELLVGARIAENEHKADPLDFALWKREEANLPWSWPSPFGPGRPGWHIECSAMAHALLGEPLDIHGGGFDLVFPHHENEIAQTEAAVDAPLARFWVHGGLLNFENRKMSKSLGNFEPLSALLERHDPRAIRLLFLQTGYRKPMNFTDESIAGASAGLERLQRAFQMCEDAPAEPAPAIEAYRERFDAALDDDVNTAGAVGVLFELAAELPRRPAAERGAAGAFLREALACCGIEDLETPVARAPAIDAELVGRLRAALSDVLTFNGDTPEAAIEKVIAARNAARRSKDFALADRLRQELLAQRIALRDSRDGTSWSVEG